MNQAVGESGKAGLRRRRQTFSRTLLDHGKPGKQSVRDPDDRDGNMGTELFLKDIPNHTSFTI